MSRRDPDAILESLCLFCGIRLPAMFGGAYGPPGQKADTPYDQAIIWCCPECIDKRGWVSAYQQAMGLLGRQLTQPETGETNE